jgi:micrococcal nuclease
MYEYKAKVIKVYDGDTITVDIDLGFAVNLHKQSIRLYGIDTPELRGDERPEGLKIKEILSSQILGKEVILKTYKDKKGKYGRWLAEVYLNGLNINKWLLENNYAKPYN